MIKIWKRLPEWAQWCLYLPCCIFFPAVGGALVSLPTMYHGAPKAGLAISLPLASLVATVVFYWCAFYLAPRAKKVAAGFLFAIFILLWIMTALHCVVGWYLNYFDVEFFSMMQLIQALVALVVGPTLFLAGFRSPQPLSL